MMRKNEYKVIVTPGGLEGKGNFSNEMVTYITAENEQDVQEQFYQNIVNRFFKREIIDIQLHRAHVDADEL